MSFLCDLGFEDVRVTAHFDCFRGTKKETTAKKYGVRGANVFARKPSGARSAKCIQSRNVVGWPGNV